MSKPIAEVELVKLEVFGFMLRHYESLTVEQIHELKNIAVSGVLDPVKEECNAHVPA